MNTLIKNDSFELLNEENELFLFGRTYLKFENKFELEEFVDLIEKGMLLGKMHEQKCLTPGQH